MVQVTRECNLKELIAASGSNYLPQVHNNWPISDFNFPLVFEFWNRPLPKVQIGSLGLPKVQSGKQTDI